MAAAHDIGLEIRRFVDEHPQGWGHDDWTGFLHHLSQSGHDVSDADSLGLALERERLLHVLGRIEIKGLGPKRREALAERFGTLHNLRSANSEDLSSVPGIPRSVAEEVAKTLR